jgi:MOSC domain-containing protein YiiM
VRQAARGLQNTGVAKNAELTRLEESLDHIRQAPRDAGTVELIVARPAVDQRETLSEGWLEAGGGLSGDTWRARGNSRTPDGSADPDAQLTLMSSRAAAAIAGERERWPLAGDQLYVDLDLSLANLPPGSRVQIGSAVIEFSEPPHTGCAKFSARYGNQAQVFVNSPVGRELRLRGANCRVVVAGTVRQGDVIRKVPS